MGTLGESVPGLASGKLKQILFSAPGHFAEVARMRTPYQLFMWFYYRYPYAFDILAFPAQVNLAVSGRCNMTCRHCIRNVVHQTPDDIEPALFKRIVKEVAGHQACRLKLSGAGEPSLHPQFCDLVRCVAKIGAQITVYTNGWLFEILSPHEIVNSGIGHVVVSVDGLDKRSFEFIRVGGNYDRLKANVVRLFRARAELKVKHPWIEIRHVISPNESPQDLLRFRKAWLVAADGVKYNKLNLYTLSPQPGRVNTPLFRRCRAIRRELNVETNGRVLVCHSPHFQYGTAEELGDLHHTGIKELWQHPRLNEVRKAHERRDVNKPWFCAACNQITN